MIRGLHHAAIGIPTGAENAAREFYTGLLGLPEIPKPASLAGRGGLWLALGDGALHVVTDDGPDRERSRAHLAYEVDDLEAWRARLGAAGIAIHETVPIEGWARFMLRDPFGNRIELVQVVG